MVHDKNIVACVCYVHFEEQTDNIPVLGKASSGEGRETHLFYTTTGGGEGKLFHIRIE